MRTEVLEVADEILGETAPDGMLDRATYEAFVLALAKIIKDITGIRFGRLAAVRMVEERARRQVQWLCRCDCGAETIVLGANLRNGHTRSCGCLQREAAAVTGAESLRKRRGIVPERRAA